jgi:hypothetical protein
MKTFKLVNPYIQGNMTTSFGGKDALNAAQSTWEELGKNISKGVPKFYFTLQDTSDKLHHFYVKETLNDGLVDYRLSKLKPKSKSKSISHFKKQLKVFDKSVQKMSGGGGRKKSRKKTKCPECGKKNCDCSDSDSDNVFSKSNNLLGWSSPISYLYYDPIVYGFDDVYLPNIVGSYPLLNYYTGLGLGYVDMDWHTSNMLMNASWNNLTKRSRSSSSKRNNTRGD